MPNMKLTQDWVGYLDRSYIQIKQSLLNRLVVSNPEITDHSEGNLLVIIISMFSGIAEMLGLYIDRQGQEAYLGTARKYSSVLKLVRLLNYRVKARRAAQVDLLFTIIDSTTSLPASLGVATLIPAGTQVNSLNGLFFFTTEDLLITQGTTMGRVGAKQSLTQTNILIGLTTGAPHQILLIGDDYVHDTISLNIGGDPYTRVDSFGLVLSGEKVFMVETDENLLAYIVLGDGVNGAIPIAGSSVQATYESTEGDLGNVPPNTIKDLVTTIAMPSGFKLQVTNPDYAFNGKPFESIEEIRANAPRSLSTLKRAVTTKDYEDLARLHPGVGDAKVTYCCGKCVKVYIAPMTRGIANAQLLQQVKDYFECKRMVGRCTNMVTAGITRIYVKMRVNAKYMVQPNDALTDVAVALDSKYGYANSAINLRVHESDITALIDGLPRVEFVNIDELWAEPYARPLEHNNPLVWVPIVLNGATIKSQWKIKYQDSTSTFEVYKESTLMGIAFIGVQFVTQEVKFTIQPGVYANGNIWDFTLYPFNHDIDLDDLTIPIIDVNLTTAPPSGFFNITVIPNNEQGSCTPVCK